jgi:penicillin-binding protein 1A
MIRRVVDRYGREIYRAPETERPVVSEATAYLMTSMMADVVSRGTATTARAAGLRVKAAGKTGTSSNFADAWFVGYTPDLATAVWVGYPRGEIEMKPSCAGSSEPCKPTRTATSGGVTGGSWPASIWRLFMMRALANQPARSFGVPDSGVVTVEFDTRNGCLAGRFTPDEYRRYGPFVAGTEPTRYCREPGDAVRVPDVLRFPIEEAVRILHSAGLAVNRSPKNTSTYPPGRVLAVSPRAGTLVPGGSTVSLTVSATSAEVPDVLGRTRSEAVAAIRAADLEPRVIVARESNSDAAERNAERVWKQAPSGGSDVDEGSTVTIWVNPDD